MPAVSERVVHDAAEVEQPLEDKFSSTAEWSSGPTVNGRAAKRKKANTAGKYEACKAA